MLTNCGIYAQKCLCKSNSWGVVMRKLLENKMKFVFIIMIISTTISIPEISGQIPEWYKKLSVEKDTEISPWVIEHCLLLSNHDITSGYYIVEPKTLQTRTYTQYDSNEECVVQTIQNGVGIGSDNIGFCGYSNETPYYRLGINEQTAYNYHEYIKKYFLMKIHPTDLRIVEGIESGGVIFTPYSESYSLPSWINNLDVWKVENKINCEEHQKSLKFLFEYYEKFHKENRIENRYYPPEHYLK
jgi:hypothetical protein